MSGYVLRDGRVILASSSFSDLFRVKLQRIGRRSVSHARVGRFSVVVLDDGMLAVRETWAPGVCDDGSIRPGTRFWRAHVSDRTRQLDEVSRRVAGHPMERDVMADVDAERLHLARLDLDHEQSRAHRLAQRLADDGHVQSARAIVRRMEPGPIPAIETIRPCAKKPR